MPTRIKSNGIHYTPPDLAAFLARSTLSRFDLQGTNDIDVLDPACGSGSLLCALADAFGPSVAKRLNLFGYETDADALESAKQALSTCPAKSVTLCNADFLALEGVPPTSQFRLFEDHNAEIHIANSFDIVIANPPYVRTQVLGAKRSRQLAEQFGLSGRVDLYHAFTKAMKNVLKIGGFLGLLTSNRFLTVRSGASLRRLLRDEFDLEAILDLGDTKLFAAAVLPVIVVARRTKRSEPARVCEFDRVYQHRAKPHGALREYATLFDAISDRSAVGTVQVAATRFHLERGFLAPSKSDTVWSLSTPQYHDWIETVEAHRQHSFEDLGHVRVGIKTTADEVFIRSDWSKIPIEQELLRPLITHGDAGRWQSPNPKGSRQVLYPHLQSRSTKSAIRLSQYPHAAAYLHSHEDRLRQRRYVTDAGREWYEIWVPHRPDDWKRPKIVFPDISEEPRFFLDRTGAVVSGECYWITARNGVCEDWLLMMLAVANSSFITKFYDIVFHNKLYAGRRRFQTQYVNKFPLPGADTPCGKEIIEQTKELIENGLDAGLEKELDHLVWEAFGLIEEI